jgi:hypothetical protein
MPENEVKILRVDRGADPREGDMRAGRGHEHMFAWLSSAYCLSEYATTRVLCPPVLLRHLSLLELWGYCSAPFVVSLAIRSWLDPNVRNLSQLRDELGKAAGTGSVLGLLIAVPIWLSANH